MGQNAKVDGTYGHVGADIRRDVGLNFTNDGDMVLNKRRKVVSRIGIGD